MPFWSGIDPGQVLNASLGPISVRSGRRSFPGTMGVAQRQIREGGGGDRQPIEFSKSCPYCEFISPGVHRMLWPASDFEGAMASVGLARCRVLAVACIMVYESSQASRYFNWLPLWQPPELRDFGRASSGLSLISGVAILAAGICMMSGHTRDIAGMGPTAAFRRSLFDKLPLE